MAHKNTYISLNALNSQPIRHSGKAFILVLEATLKLLRVGNLKWMSHFNAFYITKTKPKVAFPVFMMLGIICCPLLTECWILEFLVDDTKSKSLPVETLQLLFKIQLKVFITLGVSASIWRMHILTQRRKVSNIFCHWFTVMFLFR